MITTKILAGPFFVLFCFMFYVFLFSTKMVFSDLSCAVAFGLLDFFFCFPTPFDDYYIGECKFLQF